MADEPTTDTTRSTPYLLGRIESKLDGVVEALGRVHNQQQTTDARISHVERRLEHVETSVRGLNDQEHSREAQRQELTKRTITRRDAAIVGLLLGAWTVFLNTLAHIGDLAQQIRSMLR